MSATLTPLVYTQQNVPKTDGVTYTKLFASWFPITKDQASLCNELFEEFYLTVRLIDDVQDETRIRNGKPTANVIFGVPLTINDGMLSTTQLMQHLLEFNDTQAMKIFLEEYKLMWEGQGEQLQWTQDKRCPSLDEVVKMSEKKGVMVSLFGRFLCALSKKDDSQFVELFKKFNILLQIENDIAGTATLRDITEGQYNFVIAYAIQEQKKVNNSSTSRLEQILLTKTSDQKDLNEARDILVSTGAFEFSNNYKINLMREIIDSTKQIGGNKFCEELMTVYGTKKLVHWGIHWGGDD